MINLDADVIIVGGGPAGLMLANELGARGVTVILLDQDLSTAVNPQANATQARTMEHFRRLGFADEVRAMGLPTDYPTDIAYYTTFAGYELARFKLPSAGQAKNLVKQLSGSWSAAELPHRISQMYVEQVLLRHAQKQPSVDLRFECEVISVTDEGEHVTACAQNNDGEITVSGRYLVGCDGARSLVRHHLGFQLEGDSGIQRDFAGGHMHAVYFRSDEVYAAMCGAPAWMNVNIHHQRRCFLIAVDGKAEFVFHTQLKPGEDKDNISEIQARTMLAQCMGKAINFDIISRSSWTAGFALVAERLQEGRMFIAGDAAHLFTPMGGLGYNTAIEDVVNLGWKLAAEINGWGGRDLLASYHSERHPAAIRNTTYARKFADSLGNFKPDTALEENSSHGQELRQQAGEYFERHGRMEFNIPGITFGTRFDGSPIIVSDGTAPPTDTANDYVPTACPGGRTPHMWLADGSSLFDKLGFEFTLLQFGDSNSLTEPFADAASALGVPLHVLNIPGEEIRELFEANLALIRPDQTVAWRGNGIEDPELLLNIVRGGIPV